MQNPRVSLPSGGVREVRHGKYAAHDKYSSIFLEHTLRQTELTKEGRSKWWLWPLRPAVSCTRDGADWPKSCNRWSPKANQWFFGFIQMRDTLSTNGEHLRVAKVKSFPAIPKWMRSVNGDRNGANLKKWSVLLVCTIACWWWRYWWQHEYKWCNNQMTQSADITSVGLTTTSSRLALPSALYVLHRGMAVWFHGRV